MSLLVSTAVLVCDTDTAKQYGAIKNALREKGKPIPENDVWIAAVAKQHGLIIITRDANFAEVDGLKVAAW